MVNLSEKAQQRLDNRIERRTKKDKELAEYYTESAEDAYNDSSNRDAIITEGEDTLQSGKEYEGKAKSYTDKIADKKKRMTATANWFAQARENAGQQWRDYVDYWTLGHRRDQGKQQTTSDPATQVTNVEGKDIKNNVEGNSTNTSKSYGEQIIDNANKLNAENNKSLGEYINALKKGQGAYIELLKQSMRNKQNLAVRKERDARSKAIANALGSLVNVITAGSLARRGGYAPIVADYDKSYDTDLRKSIEGRYAMENESENLLMQLAQERYKHESELAKSMYAAEVDANTQRAKAAAEVAKIKAKAEAAKVASEQDKQDKKDIIQFKYDLENPTKTTRTSTNKSGRQGAVRNGWEDGAEGAFGDIAYAPKEVAVTTASGNATGAKKEESLNRQEKEVISKALKDLKKRGNLNVSQAKEAAKLVREAALNGKVVDVANVLKQVKK